MRRQEMLWMCPSGCLQLTSQSIQKNTYQQDTEQNIVFSHFPKILSLCIKLVWINEHGLFLFTLLHGDGNLCIYWGSHTFSSKTTIHLSNFLTLSESANRRCISPSTIIWLIFNFNQEDRRTLTVRRAWRSKRIVSEEICLLYFVRGNVRLAERQSRSFLGLFSVCNSLHLILTPYHLQRISHHATKKKRDPEKICTTHLISSRKFLQCSRACLIFLASSCIFFILHVI